MVDRTAILGINEDLLWVRRTRLELGRVRETADLMTRALGDAPYAGVVLLFDGATLHEAVAPSEGAVDGSRGIN